MRKSVADYAPTDYDRVKFFLGVKCIAALLFFKTFFSSIAYSSHKLKAFGRFLQGGSNMVEMGAFHRSVNKCNVKLMHIWILMRFTGNFSKIFATGGHKNEKLACKPSPPGASF
jgi:hypothetical protein